MSPAPSCKLFPVQVVRIIRVLRVVRIARAASRQPSALGLHHFARRTALQVSCVWELRKAGRTKWEFQERHLKLARRLFENSA